MPLVNRRRNPIDSTVAAATITDETHTVAEFDELPGVYGFILEERPVAGTVSVRQDNTAETPFTIVLTSPLAGQVFVDFNENRGYCIFNSADNGKAIIVTYDGSGANNTVENIRAIAGEEIDAQRNAASGLAEFNASRHLKLPNTAGTQTSLLTNANAAARTYTLPDKSGTVAMLDDIAAPDLGPIIDAATVASSISDTDKFAAARDASENLISVAWSLIKSSIFGAINGLTSKSTPVGADVIVIGDSAASFAGKKAPLNTLARAITQYAKLSDTKAANTNGGTFTASAWRTRDLNTEDSDADGIVSISSNQFTLQAGTYRIYASAPAYAVDRHKAKLRNTSDSSDTIIGTTEFTGTASGSPATRSIVAGEFTISAQKTFEIQHYCTTTCTTNGFGVAANVGVSEVYTVVEIWKVA